MDPQDEFAHTYEAKAESVPLARAAVAALGERLGIEEPLLGDVKTLVTEACSNVVRHAYPDGGGRFDIEAFPEGDELSIVVRDAGTGLRPDPAHDPTTMRIGLGLISQLSSHFGIGPGRDGGTVVEMRVALRAD
jgi:serine/threonine-protein kinase RsbW